MKFLTLVEWIDQEGLESLHSQHKDYTHDGQPPISFSDYVQGMYEMERDKWLRDMANPSQVRVNLPPSEWADCPIEIASAVQAFESIFNHGLTDESAMMNVISELAPEPSLAGFIVECFNEKILPAVNRTLEKIVENG